MMYLEMAVSLLLLLLGGEMLVAGAVRAAINARLSPLFIGLTVVGFGTSTPELVTSVEAALIGSPGIAIGNVVGSNIANVLLILGLAAVIYPIAVARRTLRRDGLVALLAAAACVAVTVTGALSRLAGVLLVLGLAGYVAMCYRTERTEVRDATNQTLNSIVPGHIRPGWPGALVLLIAGLAVTLLAAYMMVTSAIAIGRSAGISEAVLGVTVVAVGTSLPELVTSALAAVRRQPDIAFGNIIGSNVFNVFGILGTTAVIQPSPVPRELVVTDIWVMLGATVLLLVFASTGGRLSRGEGILLLLGYLGYLLLLSIE